MPVLKKLKIAPADERYMLDSRLDERGKDFYLDMRHRCGKLGVVKHSHNLCMVLALNDQREREKGLNWSAYEDMERRRSKA